MEDVDNVGGVGGGHQDGRELDDLQERRYAVSMVAVWSVTNVCGWVSFFASANDYVSVISFVTLLINKRADDKNMHF